MIILPLTRCNQSLQNVDFYLYFCPLRCSLSPYASVFPLDLRIRFRIHRPVHWITGKPVYSIAFRSNHGLFHQSGCDKSSGLWGISRPPGCLCPIRRRQNVPPAESFPTVMSKEEKFGVLAKSFISALASWSTFRVS